jgi:hypothetical protein
MSVVTKEENELIGRPLGHSAVRTERLLIRIVFG